MKPRRDFWESLEEQWANLGSVKREGTQVISQVVKASVSKTGNAGSNPASSAINFRMGIKWPLLKK